MTSRNVGSINICLQHILMLQLLFSLSFHHLTTKITVVWHGRKCYCIKFYISFSRALMQSLFSLQASSMHNPARLFLSVRALGAPAVVVFLAIQGVFRGLKDTKTPLLYSSKYWIPISLVFCIFQIGLIATAPNIECMITTVS